MAEEKNQDLNDPLGGNDKSKKNKKAPATDLVSLYGQYYRQQAQMSFRGAMAIAQVFGPSITHLNAQKAAKDKHFEELMSVRNTLFDNSLIPEGTEEAFKNQLLIDGKAYRDIAHQLAGMSPNHKYYDQLVTQMNQITGRYEQSAYDAQVLQSIRNQDILPEDWAYLPKNEKEMYMNIKSGNGSNFYSIGGSMYYLDDDLVSVLTPDNGPGLPPGMITDFGGRLEHKISIVDAMNNADSVGNFTVETSKIKTASWQQDGGIEVSGNIFELLDEMMIHQEDVFYKKVSGLKNIPMKNGMLENQIGTMIQDVINDGIKNAPFIREFYKAKLNTLYSNNIAGKNGLMSSIFDGSNLYDANEFLLQYITDHSSEMDLFKDFLPKPTRLYQISPNVDFDFANRYVFEEKDYAIGRIRKGAVSGLPWDGQGNEEDMGNDLAFSMVMVFPELKNILPSSSASKVAKHQVIPKLYKFYQGLNDADKQIFMYYYDLTQFGSKLGLANTLYGPLQRDDGFYESQLTTNDKWGNWYARDYYEWTGADGYPGDGQWGDNSKAAEKLLFAHWGVKDKDGILLTENFDMESYLENELGTEDMIKVINNLEEAGWSQNLQDEWVDWVLDFLEQKHSLEDYEGATSPSKNQQYTQIIEKNIKDAVGGVPEHGYIETNLSGGNNTAVYSWNIIENYDGSAAEYDEDLRTKPGSWDSDDIVLFVWDFTDNKWKKSDYNAGSDDKDKISDYIKGLDLEGINSNRDYIFRLLKNKTADY
jgi:hypothetical protein